jgi:hypothetical protein
MAKKPLPTPGANVPAAPNGVFATVWYAWFKTVENVLREDVAARQTVTSNTTPTADDIPEGESRVWHDTSTAETRLYANVGGSLKSVLLS